MMSGLFSSPTAEVALVLDGSATREKMPVPEAGVEYYIPIYDAREPISGAVAIGTPKGRKFDFAGIRVELVGTLIIANPEETREFLNIPREVAKASIISQDTTYPFAFPRSEKPYETYFGLTFRVRYVLRMTIIRTSAPNITKDSEIWMQLTTPEPGFNPMVKIEAGFPDLLQLEYEIYQQKYDLQGVVLGKVYFISVQTAIKSMELSLLRRESVGYGDKSVKEHEILGRFEVMDGQPVRSDSVPLRLYLAQFPLGPTYRNICGSCNVRYFLNLIVTDEADQKFYKRQELELWRGKVGRSVCDNYMS